MRESPGAHRTRVALAWALAVVGVLTSSPALAESLQDALTQTFAANPIINAQRANVNATGENLPKARAGYLPRVTATAEGGYRYEKKIDPDGDVEDKELHPRTYRLEVTQNVFDSFRTWNTVDQAKAQDLGALETLRNTEQNTLLEAAQAYIDVIASRSLVNLNNSHTAALQRQLEHIRGRKKFGDVTGTDVVQVEARVENGKAQTSLAEARLKGSIATYDQIIGNLPEALVPAPAVDGLIPASRDEALEIAMQQHPAIRAALHGVDAALLQVRIVQSEFMPSVNLNGSVRKQYDVGERHDEELDAVALVQVKIPIFQGGEVLARTRQAKHVSTQRQLESNSIRNQVRAGVMSSWAQLQSAKSRLVAAQAQVRAAEAAVSGVSGEARLGARTNFDVLEAEEDLLDAQTNLVGAQRDRVLATYAVARAIGALDFKVLNDILSQPSDSAVRFAEFAPRRPSKTTKPAVPLAKLKASTKKKCTACIFVLRPGTDDGVPARFTLKPAMLDHKPANGDGPQMALRPGILN